MAGKGSGRRPTDPANVLDCEADGHAMPDLKGRCWRCGARWFPPLPPMVPDPEYTTTMRTPGPHDGEPFRIITLHGTIATPTPKEPT